MNELQVINEQEVLGKEFRVYGSVDEPLFLAKDVANWIDNKNVSQMLNVVDDDEKGIYNVYTLGGNQDVWFLTENGLYEVLMMSRKPIAKAFKKEVKKILKQIRLTGEYTTPQLTRKEELQLAILNGDDLERICALQEYEGVVVEKATKPLIEKIEKDKPKVTFANRVLKSNDNVLVRQVAKMASDEGFVIGERKLYKKLREWGYICNGSTEPTQVGMNRNYFTLKINVVQTPYGIKSSRTTLVTPKGQIHIVERLMKEMKS